MESQKELWKTKDAIASKYGYDVRALAARPRAKRHENDKQVVDHQSIKWTQQQTQDRRSAVATAHEPEPFYLCR